MATKFDLEPTADPAVRVLKVSGEVDMETSPGLKEQIQKALKGAKTLKVDLSGVGYLDSSGIAVLIQGLKEAQRAKVEYSLLDPSPQVKAVIALAMLQQVFRIETSGGS